MFLIPLYHKDYFARAPVDLSEDNSPIPSIRGGTPVPVASNEASSSRSQLQTAPQQAAPSDSDPSPAQQAANNKDRLAAKFLALSRQVKASSFSSDSGQHFDNWFAQLEDLEASISSNSFAAPNARLRKQ
ncbi:predicted protein [Lichtheimia corymbifera JMRC:FSU:9682]|nr:predicted protein [Lichtheimia corymbifera JMRC:FSU:9682]